MKLEEYKPLKENKSHFTTDFLYNTYLCSIPLDFSEVPLHWHNEMELIYIKKGCGIVSVDLERFIVHGGDLVVVMPGHIHSISQNSNDRFGISMYFLCFRLRVFVFILAAPAFVFGFEYG